MTRPFLHRSIRYDCLPFSLSDPLLFHTAVPCCSSRIYTTPGWDWITSSRSFWYPLSVIRTSCCRYLLVVKQPYSSPSVLSFWGQPRGWRKQRLNTPNTSRTSNPPNPRTFSEVRRNVYRPWNSGTCFMTAYPITALPSCQRSSKTHESRLNSMVEPSTYARFCRLPAFKPIIPPNRLFDFSTEKTKSQFYLICSVIFTTLSTLDVGNTNNFETSSPCILLNFSNTTLMETGSDLLNR